MYTHDCSHGVPDVVAGNSTPRVVAVDESQTQIALYERSVLSLLAELGSFRSPDESLEYLRDNQVNLVLLDLAMTGRDGLGWLREMRGLSGHENTPVVVITSKDYAQDRLLAKELGALDYLVKPLKSQEIRELICRHGNIQPLETDNASQ